MGDKVVILQLKSGKLINSVLILFPDSHCSFDWIPLNGAVISRSAKKNSLVGVDQLDYRLFLNSIPAHSNSNLFTCPGAVVLWSLLFCAFAVVFESSSDWPFNPTQLSFSSRYLDLSAIRGGYWIPLDTRTVVNVFASWSHWGLNFHPHAGPSKSH